jgi:amino acid transporter
MRQPQAASDLGTIGGEGLGPFGANPGDGLTGIVNIISSVIGLMTIAAGVWFLFQFIVGGFNMISAGGDKAKLQSSRDRLTNSFIGLIVVVAGWSILALASTFFGVDFTLSRGGLLEQLSPNQ